MVGISLGESVMGVHLGDEVALPLEGEHSTDDGLGGSRLATAAQLLRGAPLLA